MAWSWNSSCNWRKLDNIPCMLYFTDTYYSPFWGNFQSLELLNKYFISLIHSILCKCSRRFCIICDRWQLSHLMLNFFSNLFRIHLSMFYFSLMCTPKTIIIHLICFFLCSKNITIRFSRRTDVMPPVPLETKHHPSAVDLLLIKRLIAETAKQNLLQFLQHEFVNIGKSYAERLIG